MAALINKPLSLHVQDQLGIILLVKRAVSQLLFSDHAHIFVSCLSNMLSCTQLVVSSRLL